MTGVVLEYDGVELRLQTDTGRVVEIPADRVLRVESTWTDSQVRGDTLLESGKWDEARDAYRQALQQERREWVRSMIRAGLLICHRNLGETDQAVGHFVLLLRSDPLTPFFDLIPLAWQPSEPSTALLRRAEACLASSDAPAATLLGASWLLATDRRATAVAALNRLSTHADRRIAQLAIAQLWRTRLVNATPAEVDRWQNMIRQMAPPLRAGPYFVAGKALVQQQQPERAALTLLRVPILYPEQRGLAAECLLLAAGQLKTLDSHTEAVSLYRELTQAYPESAYADAARAELERLQRKEQKPAANGD